MSQVDNLNIYFVLPYENASEDDCSSDMTLAYGVVEKYGGKVKWVKPSDCLKESHRAGIKDVFVFEKFEGEAFEKLKDLSAKILGARCILTCVIDGRSIPPGSSPMFTEGMRDLIVCSTGFDLETKRIMGEKIQYMSGVYDRSLRSITTHIVAFNNVSSKAIEAYKSNIPVMRLEWIEAVWEKSSEQNVNGRDEEFKKYISPLFHNLKITTSGIVKKEKEKIKDLIISNGGTFTGTMEEKSTNIVIVSKPEGDKYRFAKAWKIVCLKPSWIYECVSLKKIVPLKNHILEENPKCSTPERDNTNLSVNFSLVSNIAHEPERQITHLEESLATMTNFSSVRSQFQVPKILSRTESKSDYTDVIDVLLKKIRESGQFLDGCNVFLSGFYNEDLEKLKKILNMGGATRFNELTECVTHVIVGKKIEANLASLRSSGAHILSVDWLVESMNLKKPAPESDFLLVKNSPNSSEPPSPLSKQGAKLLSKTDNKTIQKPTFDLENEKTDEVEKDLLCRYNSSQPGEALSQNENPQIRSNISSASKTSPHSYNDDFFKGLFFFISSELSEEEKKQLEEVIVDRGGQIVGKRFSGVPDYAIVPITGASLTEMTPKEIVNIFFIKDCCLNGRLEPLQYYHQPVALVKNAAPLKNCVVTISNYVQCEREFIELLIDLLGAVAQSVLARKPKPGVLKSTHLICVEPSGQKYNGALKWEVPVVHHDWLLKCASLGIRVSERPYLIGESKNLTPVASASKIQSNPVTEIGLESNSVRMRSKAASVTEIGCDLNDFRVREEVEKLPPTELSRLKTSSKDSPVHNAVSRLKAMESTPKNSPDPDRTVTPTSPYGAFYGNDNPSPGTRKRLLKWMQQGAEFPLDSPVRKNEESNRRDSTPISELLSRQLLMMKRKPEELPPDSPEAAPTKKLNLDVKEPESEERNKQNSVISSGLQKMKEIEENFAKNRPKPATPIRKSSDAAQIPVVTESQPHTEVGWEDPTEKEVALKNLEKSAAKSPTKIFMLSNVENNIEELKKLIEEKGGKVSQLSYFDKTATHLIIGKLTRGEKVMGSIAAGLWVLHPSYVDELKTVRNVNAIAEEDHEWGSSNRSVLLNSLGSSGRELAVAAVSWRKTVQNGGLPPFKDMKIILHMPPSKYDSFKRLLEAGGGEVLNAKPPFSGPIDATLCICENLSADKIDFESLARQRIRCVTVVFIVDHILRKPDAIEKNFAPGFSKYWNA